MALYNILVKDWPENKEEEDNSNSNNLRLILVKTNRSALHTA